jgi:hypothetical protein
VDLVDGGTAAFVEYLHEDSFYEDLGASDENDQIFEETYPEDRATGVVDGPPFCDDCDDEYRNRYDEEGRLFVVYFFETFHQLILYKIHIISTRIAQCTIKTNISISISINSSKIRLVVKLIRIVETPSDDFDDVRVFSGSCNSLLVVDLSVYIQFFDVGAGGYFDDGFHGLW